MLTVWFKLHFIFNLRCARNHFSFYLVGFFLFFFVFFASYCYFFVSKKLQNCNVTNFCIISNLLHHKYNDKDFSKGTCETSYPAQNKVPRQTRVPVKPVFPWNQYWMQKLFRPLMQKSILFCSKSQKICKNDKLTGFYWSVLRKLFSSNTHFLEYWKKFATCDIILFFLVFLL